LKLTKSFAAVAENPVPVTVTEVPEDPLVGVKLVTVTGTVKLALE
jgi:hypothetical protein